MKKMISIEKKYLRVTVEYLTFISMRFFDKVFFAGCGATSAAMLNFILVPSPSNFFIPSQRSWPQFSKAKVDINTLLVLNFAGL